MSKSYRIFDVDKLTNEKWIKRSDYKPLGKHDGFILKNKDFWPYEKGIQYYFPIFDRYDGCLHDTRKSREEGPSDFIVIFATKEKKWTWRLSHEKQPRDYIFAFTS